MEFIYRILGFFAAINQWMGRNSIYFVPLNVIALLGSIGLAAGGFMIATDAYGKLESAPVSVTPVNATLSELLNKSHAEGAYITVKAELEPDLLLQYGSAEKNSDELKSVDNAWAPLIDRRTGRALYVALQGKDAPVAERGLYTVTGVLKPLDSRVAAELQKSSGRLESGEIGALCNVNASSSFMGITTAKREGIWNFAAAPGDIKSVEPGDLYYGFKRRTSVRLLTRDGRRLILSFARPEDRAGFLNELRAVPELSALLRAG